MYAHVCQSPDGGGNAESKGRKCRREEETPERTTNLGEKETCKDMTCKDKHGEEEITPPCLPASHNGQVVGSSSKYRAEEREKRGGRGEGNLLLLLILLQQLSYQ